MCTDDGRTQKVRDDGPQTRAPPTQHLDTKCCLCRRPSRRIRLLVAVAGYFHGNPWIVGYDPFIMSASQRRSSLPATSSSTGNWTLLPRSRRIRCTDT